MRKRLGTERFTGRIIAVGHAIRCHVHVFSAARCRYRPINAHIRARPRDLRMQHQNHRQSGGQFFQQVAVGSNSHSFRDCRRPLSLCLEMIRVKLGDSARGFPWHARIRCCLQVSECHPDGHSDHHEILGERDEAKRNVA